MRERTEMGAWISTKEAVLAALRTAAPVLLKAVLQLATTGLENNARPIAARCPHCQQRRGVHSRRTRHVQTRLDPARLKRSLNHCWACARGWSPPDRVLAWPLSADQYGSGALGRAAWGGHHLSRSRQAAGGSGRRAGRQRSAARAGRTDRGRTTGSYPKWPELESLPDT
jgi:hypothetical protein